MLFRFGPQIEDLTGEFTLRERSESKGIPSGVPDFRKTVELGAGFPSGTPSTISRSSLPVRSSLTDFTVS